MDKSNNNIVPKGYTLLCNNFFSTKLKLGLDYIYVPILLFNLLYR